MPSVFDESSLKALEQAVGKAEKSTSAEFVVVLARVSGRYRSTDQLWGLIFGLVALAVILYIPWEVELDLVVPDVAVAAVVGALLSHVIPPMRRVLARPAQRLVQARNAAKLAFVNHQVTATRERTGVLVYFSEFEGVLEIMPDLEVQARVPTARFNEIVHRFLAEEATVATSERVIRAIDALTEAVKQEFPPRPENPDELPDRPRLELV